MLLVAPTFDRTVEWRTAVYMFARVPSAWHQKITERASGAFLSSFNQQILFTMIFVFAQPDLIHDYPVTAGVHLFQGKAAAACSSAILMTIGLPV